MKILIKVVQKILKHGPKVKKLKFHWILENILILQRRRTAEYSPIFVVGVNGPRPPDFHKPGRTLLVNDGGGDRPAPCASSSSSLPCPRGHSDCSIAVGALPPFPNCARSRRGSFSTVLIIVVSCLPSSSSSRVVPLSSCIKAQSSVCMKEGWRC